MNVDNLAMVMGPTILGNSSNEPMAVMSEVSTLNNHLCKFGLQICLHLL